MKINIDVSLLNFLFYKVPDDTYIFYGILGISCILVSSRQRSVQPEKGRDSRWGRLCRHGDRPEGNSGDRGEGGGGVSGYWENGRNRVHLITSHPFTNFCVSTTGVTL